MAIAGKKMLILGGATSNLNMVEILHELGVKTLVTDNAPVPGDAKRAADETADISTTDIDALVQLCKDRNVDAVYTGASEFNIRNCIRVCEKNGMRFYTDMKTWDNCANKATFKQFCRDFGIDTPEQFDISENSTDEEIASLPYPVIVKPVDSSSSNGITVCYEASQIREACRFARSYSITDAIVVEKFIENGRLITAFSYFVKDGEPYCVFSCDDFQCMQSATPFHQMNSTPSKHLQYFMDNVHPKVCKMLKAMGVQNGSLFFQTLPYEGKIYFMEMGYRIGGGIMHRIIVPAVGFHITECMVRFLLGEEICSDEKLKAVDPRHPRCSGGQFSIPLNAGTIARVEGLDEVEKMPGILLVRRYYHEGDTVEKRVIGTLGQHLMMCIAKADDVPGYIDIVRTVQDTVKVYDTEGNLMNTMHMDFDRLIN
jgi:biotin carboxylase